MLRHFRSLDDAYTSFAAAMLEPGWEKSLPPEVLARLIFFSGASAASNMLAGADSVKAARIYDELARFRSQVAETAAQMRAKMEQQRGK